MIVKYEHVRLFVFLALNFIFSLKFFVGMKEPQTTQRMGLKEKLKVQS